MSIRGFCHIRSTSSQELVLAIPTKKYWLRLLKDLRTIILSFSPDTFIQADGPYVRAFVVFFGYQQILIHTSDICFEATPRGNDDFTRFRGCEFSRASHPTLTYICLDSAKFQALWRGKLSSWLFDWLIVFLGWLRS